jgi:two-component system LytT family sensor kinase
LATSPLKTLRFRLLFSIGWWILAIVHALVLNSLGYDWKIAILDSSVSNLILVGISLVIAVMLQYYIPQKNRYIHILALSIVFSLIWLLISRSILLLIANDVKDYVHFFSQSVPIRLAIGFLIIGCMSLVSVLWYTIQDQQEIELRKTEAEKLAKEAELYKLRQQLQPHFLFNSLNSINALIGTKPQLARTMIQQLSDFLRGTLKKEEHQWISLKEELQFLELYLDIEKVRFGHRLSTVINNDTDGTASLPAMLLQPVVENAIKFGLYDTTGDITIIIDVKRENDYLIVQVRNPFDPTTSNPNKGTGFGLNSVQRRLYLLFAQNDLLKTEAKEEIFITTIKIPQVYDQGGNN